MGERDLRVSDAEREEVARMLRDHCAVGRLSIEDLDRRLDGAYGAQTRADLEPVTRDLPMVPVPANRKPQGKRWFWPGVAAFHEERRLSASCEASYGAALREIVPRMGMQGFHLIEDIAPRRLRFRSDTGLDVTVMFHPALDGGSDVSAFGQAPRGVRKAFANLRD